MTAVAPALTGRVLTASIRRLASPGLLLVVACLIRVPTLSEPLLELHAFRQTQTAYTALLYAANGIDLLHPRLPVLGPSAQVPFEFPLPEAAGALLIRTGLPPDLAMRTFGLVTFLCAAALVWLVARRLAGDTAASFALAAYVFAPVNLLWGRASTIEYSVLSLALLSVYATLRATGGSIRWGWLGLAAVAGALAAAIKIPAWIGWLALMVVAGHLGGRLSRSRWAAFLLLVLAVPGIAGLAWTIYADSVKSAHPLTSALTTVALRDFNFGSLQLRADPVNWLFLTFSVATLVVGVGSATLLAYRRPFELKVAPPVILALLSAAIGPVLIFFGLYVHNDYYVLEIAPAWAVLVGIAFAGVRPATARSAAATLAIVISVAVGFPYWSLAFRGPDYDPGGWLTIASEVDQRSGPSDNVLVLGDDWSSTTLYYARRQGVAAGAWVTPAALADSGLDIRIAAVVEPERSPLELLSVAPWVGSVSQHVYLLGSTEDAIDAPISAGDALSLPPGALPISGPIGIDCADGTRTLPIRPGTSVLELNATDAPGTRVWLTPSLAPLPSRRFLVIRGSADHLSARCSETRTVTVKTVWWIPPESGP